jgi:AcrR family transcriptional regulator
MIKVKKKDITRAKIMEAARKVFSKESYNAASIRMIASEGGFDFGIIRYHFPNKAELFKACLKKACDDFFEGYKDWTKGLHSKSTEENFSLYLDRFLEYHFEHPETLRIIMNNIYMSDDPKFEIPGYEYVPEVIFACRKVFKENFKMVAPQEEIDRFNDCFEAHAFMLLGASSYQAHLLGLEPESNEYRQWVKDTLMYFFLPHLENLFFPTNPTAI